MGHVEVRVLTSDKTMSWVKAKAAFVPDEYEVILSDRLTEELGIAIKKSASGKWRFIGEKN